MILILTQAYDTHANLVTAELDRRRTPFVRFNTADLATGAELSVDNLSDRLLWRLECGGTSVELEQVTSVWFRRGLLLPERELAAPALDTAVRGVVRLLAQRLESCFWMNAFWPDQRAHAKPYQLKVAAEVGCDIPRTLLTNRPDDAVAFCSSCGGEMIYKATEPFRMTDDGGRVNAIYTSKVTQHDIQSLLDGISMVPCLFQERLRRQSEIRVTVVGSSVFAAELLPGHDLVDIRLDRRKIACQATVLPAKILLQVRELLGRLGLVYASMDFVKTVDGRLVFLEVNPSGQWYWIEQLTGLPILDAVVTLLLHQDAAISR